MSYTVAKLEISAAAYDEIHEKLERAGYSHTFEIGEENGLIDMHGIGLIRGAEAPAIESPDAAQLAIAYGEALNDANGLCRSAYSIACRQGVQTNWPAFRDRMRESLERQALAMTGVLHIPADMLDRTTATAKTFRIHARIAAALCEDEGCPQANTPHVCSDRESSLKQMNNLLEERGMHYGVDALEGVLVGWELAHEVNGGSPDNYVMECAKRDADGVVTITRYAIRDWPTWLHEAYPQFSKGS